MYRESRNIRAIDRAAFRDDLCMLVSPELCPSTDDWGYILLSSEIRLMRSLVTSIVVTGCVDVGGIYTNHSRRT